MSPHAQYLHDARVSENLIDKPALDIDAAGKCATQISQKFFEGRRFLKRISGEQSEDSLGLRLKASLGEATGVFLCLLRKDDLPRGHQPGSFSHSSIGVASPSRIDSHIPGTESRWRVS